MLLAVVSILLAACSTTPEGPIPMVNTEQGVALKGYDPVAYFTEGKPTPGNETISADWEDVTYHFSSEENRREFEANPERYVPQYGGYCAYAIAINRIADIDPEEWAIVDDKLYLNANFLAQGLWDADRDGNIESGDKYWQNYPKANLVQPVNTTDKE
ncbi:YHS domain-containing (seleno)protein [Rubellicoccus peritrichatus]|uniref:YHS domain-containing (Seleno)protein n=1 Tax=Rubellicoccus peritrichatus TaxID=3080537 RepID=A0AAQ3L5Q1_9BACT|nr:YHS domain-containing (seleno)protein [Puniceicoccus sp. CR14]WOO39297.1 YHS domain-containing (seleno)protein [Puniceicoccus sp. CR14]